VSDDLTFRILFAVTYAVFAVVRGYYNRKSRRGAPRRSRQERIEAITQHGKASGYFFLVLFWVFVVVVALYLVDSPWIAWSYFLVPVEIRWAGLALGILVVPLVWWSHRTLGESFSYALETKNEHRLVTSGPYAKVRHPIYTAHTLFNLGMVLVAANWLILLLWAIAMPYTYHRMFNEEKMMVEEFGDEYVQYMKRTGRLFPKISSSSDS
jgi:protein-S-isoprenylcysteine O-methyltransferase Ste14